MFLNLIAGFFLNKLVVLSIDLMAIFLGYLVFRDNPKGKINRAYLATTILMFIWVNGAWVTRLTGETEHAVALLLLKLAWVAAPLFFAYLYYLTVILINREKENALLTKVVFGLGIVSALVLGLTESIVKDYTIVNPIIVNIGYGPLIIPFLAIVFLIVVATVIPVLKDKSVLKDPKIQTFLTGLFVFYWANIIFNISLPIFFGISQFYFLGDYSTIIFLGFTAFTIIKYQLFNIKVIAAEFFTFFISMLLVFRLSRSASFEDTLVDGTILALSVLFGFLLIKSVINEVKQKEELQVLSLELKDLNENLQEKVDEQTKEIKRAYEVEKKARQDLAELDESKTQFILATEHHLRTPLTIVKGYVGTLLEKKSSSLDEESKSFLTKANDATVRITDLVNELLEISQMEVGKSILKLESVNIKDLIMNVMNGFKFDIDVKQIKTVFSFSESPEENTLNLNKEKIVEAFSNIVSNAVKYNKMAGEIRVAGKIITNENNQKIYQLTVEDQGIGVKPENISKIFTQYFERGAEARKVYATGRGIGLVITKNIIKAHKGTIRVESEGEGKGSKFIIELPIG
jgi:signal transduction histidine kinase